MKRFAYFALPAVAAFCAVAVAANFGRAADLGGYKDHTAYAAPETTAAPGWSGLYIGVMGGYSSHDVDVSRNSTYEGGHHIPSYECIAPLPGYEGCVGGDGNIYDKGSTVPEFYSPSLASYGIVGGESFDLSSGFLGGEVSYKANMNGFILEPFASATFGGDKFSRTWDGDEQAVLDGVGTFDYNETGSFSFEKNWDATFGLKAGALVTPRVYAYGLLGATIGSFDAKYSNAIQWEGGEAVPPVSYSDTEDLWGVTFGGGLEYAVTKRVHFGLEGRYTLYEDKDIKLSDTKIYDNQSSWRSTNDKITISPDGEWSVLGRISYRFGGN